MKKIILLIVGCLVILNISSQPQSWGMLSYNNVVIPIYANPVDDKVSYTIMQDTINDFYFSVQFLENSPLRFKVSIRYVATTPEGPEIIGWIDKAQCGVFKRWYYDEDKKQYIKLYSEPEKSASFVKIYEDPTRCEAYVMTLIDYMPDNWVKVIFYQNDTLYEGWVDRYCSNPYDSCN